MGSREAVWVRGWKLPDGRIHIEVRVDEPEKVTLRDFYPGRDHTFHLRLQPKSVANRYPKAKPESDWTQKGMDVRTCRCGTCRCDYRYQCKKKNHACCSSSCGGKKARG